jgi:hypothetical protein
MIELHDDARLRHGADRQKAIALCQNEGDLAALDVNTAVVNFAHAETPTLYGLRHLLHAIELALYEVDGLLNEAEGKIQSLEYQTSQVVAERIERLERLQAAAK